MSIAKEEAKKMVWEYYHEIEHVISDEYSSKDWEIAKQCALISAKRIEKEWKREEGRTAKQNFWKEIIEEIEKL